MNERSTELKMEYFESAYLIWMLF